MLSFLGRGVQPPTPAWGMMIFESQSYFLNAPWLVFIPGAAILILALVLQSRRRRPARCPRPDPAGPQRMIGYLARRLVASLLILIGVTMVTFVPHLHDPGRSGGHDRRAQCHGPRCASRSATSSASTGRCRCNISLISDAWRSGDFGQLLRPQERCRRPDRVRLPPTLLLMLGAIIAELLIGIPAGIYAASRRGRSADKVAMTLSFVTRLDAAIRRRAHPALCLRLSAELVSARRLWLPRATSCCRRVTLGIAGGGWYSRMMRSSMIEVLRQDYIRTARAKGMTRRPRPARPWRAQRVAADHRHDRPRHRHLHVGRRGGRECVRLAGHRPAHVAGHPVARHSDHHGRHDGRGRASSCSAISWRIWSRR